ncbi:MAG: hypothetical protein ACPGGK_15730 [Pikeienuella sp.]
MRNDKPDEPVVHHPTTKAGKRSEMLIAGAVLTGLWAILLFIQIIPEEPFFDRGRFASFATVAAYTGPLWVLCIMVWYRNYLSK